MSRIHPVIIESKPISKAGSYCLMLLGGLLLLLMLQWPVRQPAVGTGAVVCGISVSLALIIGPLWYGRHHKRQRLTLTLQQFHLVQLPDDKLVAAHAMSTLLKWWRVRQTFQDAAIDALHLDFKHGGRICIHKSDFAGYEELLGFLQRHFGEKQAAA